MSMMVSFVLSFFPRDVLDEILNLIESVSEDLPSYSYTPICRMNNACKNTSQRSCVNVSRRYTFYIKIYFMHMRDNFSVRLQQGRVTISPTGD